ncbi:hypothetical protein [Rhodococcus artemisiae]|uniref:Uncharacterized protein n=1 Tax=Rhodococcus artemisiae TaxID=714159 RepID=A0ABU7LEY8_9NOCA|nr:hypothetical protein [Rhodococcus artemisiae]MEE2060106.1 hypothetical protein [Rhodococcus artemisiae]
MGYPGSEIVGFGAQPTHIDGASLRQDKPSDPDRYGGTFHPVWKNIDPGAHAIPAPARPLLVAARTFQAVRGAEPHRALFRGGLGGTGSFARESAEACGLALPPRHQRDAQRLSTVTAHLYAGPDLR